jgi:hypothetical protein
VNALPDEVVTPEVLIDVEVLQRNIHRLAGVAHARGFRLRPHVKTHKVWEIAALQLASGAMGLTVASIPRRCVLDTGSKVLCSDRPSWASGWGRLADHPAARITALSEHHATVVWPDGDPFASSGRTVTGYPQSRVPDHEPGGRGQRRARRSRRRPVGGSRPRLQQPMEWHQCDGGQASPGEPQGQPIVPAGNDGAFGIA